MTTMIERVARAITPPVFVSLFEERGYFYEYQMTQARAAIQAYEAAVAQETVAVKEKYDPLIYPDWDEINKAAEEWLIENAPRERGDLSMLTAYKDGVAWIRARIRLRSALSPSQTDPAPEIAALMAEIERLRKALMPFANDAAIYDGQGLDDSEESFNDNITIGDIRRARAAIAPRQDEAK